MRCTTVPITLGQGDGNCNPTSERLEGSGWIYANLQTALKKSEKKKLGARTRTHRHVLKTFPKPSVFSLLERFPKAFFLFREEKARARLLGKKSKGVRVAGKVGSCGYQICRHVNQRPLPFQILVGAGGEGKTRVAHFTAH